MVWLTKLLGFFSNPVADVVGGWNARKNIAAESTAKIAQAEVNLKVTKLLTKAKQLERESEMDFDYDTQVLKNRNNTFADELIIIIWFLVFIMHFVPITQPYMNAGWSAMGYKSGPAWWFEFGMVGILVSTLGLFRVLKLMVSRFGGGDSQNKKVLLSHR